NADCHRPSRPASKRNQNARGNTRGGPKYRHARLEHHQQGQTRGQEIGNADTGSEEKWANPLLERRPYSRVLLLDVLSKALKHKEPLECRRPEDPQRSSWEL